MREFRIAFTAAWVALICGIPGSSRAAPIEAANDFYVDLEGPVFRLTRDGAALALPEGICRVLVDDSVRIFALGHGLPGPVAIPGAGLTLYWPDCDPDPTLPFPMTVLPEGTETIWLQDVTPFGTFGAVVFIDEDGDPIVPDSSSPALPFAGFFAESPEQAPLALTKLLMGELVDDLEADPFWKPSWPWQPNALEKKLDRIWDALEDTTDGLASTIEERLAPDVELGPLRPLVEQLYAEAFDAADRAKAHLKRCRQRVKWGDADRALGVCTLAARAVADVQRATELGFSVISGLPTGRLGAIIQGR